MEFESSAGGRAFDYYMSQSAPILGSIMDSEFWGGLVMRLSTTEPIVRHAVLSLSSLHEFVSAKRADKRYMDPTMVFAEYSKAIRALQKWNQSDGPVIPLIASLLFTCIEFLLDNEAGAKMHILQGRKLICDLEGTSSQAADLIKQDLVPMYTRLGLAAFLYGSTPPEVPESLKAFITPPREFRNIAEARALLYHLLDQVLRFSTASKPRLYNQSIDIEELLKLTSDQRRILLHLDQWQGAFTVLTASEKPNHAMQATQHLLQIYYHAAVVWLSTSLSPYETEYDSHIASFASIIGHASSIINSSNRGSNLHAFSFETELVAPIYWTATKCRHPTLRRAAVKLLMRDELKGRRENLWHSNEAIAISLRVIELEEQESENAFDAFSSIGSSPSMSPGNPGSGSSGGSSVGTSFEYQIPIHKPPTIPLEDYTELLQEESSTSPEAEQDKPGIQEPDFNTLPPTARVLKNIAWGRISTEQPFGIAEMARVKNTIIGAREKEGVWATIFREPQQGEEQWDICKEFLRFRA